MCALIHLFCTVSQNSCLPINGSSRKQSASSAGFRFTFIAVGGLVLSSTRRSVNDNRVQCMGHLSRSAALIVCIRCLHLRSYGLFVLFFLKKRKRYILSKRSWNDNKEKWATYWNGCVLCVTVATKKNYTKEKAEELWTAQCRGAHSHVFFLSLENCDMERGSCLCAWWTHRVEMSTSCLRPLVVTLVLFFTSPIITRSAFCQGEWTQK